MNASLFGPSKKEIAEQKAREQRLFGGNLSMIKSPKPKAEKPSMLKGTFSWR